MRVAGKAFAFKGADGVSLRIEYKANGYAFINTSRGFSDSGKWHVDGSTLCVDWQKAKGGCSEARLRGDSLYVRRTSNGEIVALVEN